MGSNGIIQVGNNYYIERPQVFPFWALGVAANQLLLGQRVALPGSYAFRLKALARDVIAGGARVSRPFLFRLGGSSDSSWYTGGAVPLNSTGQTTDRVLDTNIFGSGQFPSPIVPDILYPASSQITFEIQDISGVGPYDIHIAFIGAYLIQVNPSQNSVVGQS